MAAETLLPTSVHFRPLEQVLSASGERGGERGAQAHLWIGQPSLAMDPRLAGDLEEEEGDRLSSLLLGEWGGGGNGWDCDGCPPPYFDLPPPPRPPELGDADYCQDGQSNNNPYESCDHLPTVIDSGSAEYNDLLNVLVVVAVAAVVVAVAIVAACVVWRKRLSLPRTFAMMNSKQRHHGHHHHHGAFDAATTATNSSSSASAVTPPHKKMPLGGGPHHQDIELHETPSATPVHRSSHVYANPGYPTLEIGGLPFYLVPSNSSNSGCSPPPNSSSRDTSLTTNPPHLYEPPGYVPSSASARSGPIYEDIDRMCTYRGAPPEHFFQQQQQQQHHQPHQPPPHPNLIPNSPPFQHQSPLSGRGGRRGPQPRRGERDNDIGGDNRTYCNVPPSPQQASLSPFASPAKVPRPESSDSSSNNRNNAKSVNSGTSSSEVSFDSSNSSGNNRTNGGTGGPNVVVNPLSTPNKLRQRVASPSVYYYSDTLRPKQQGNNAGFAEGDDVYAEAVDDDVGVGGRPPLPSQRLANLSRSPATSERGRRTTNNGRVLSPTLSERSLSNNKGRKRTGKRTEVRV